MMQIAIGISSVKGIAGTLIVSVQLLWSRWFGTWESNTQDWENYF